ncbi:hypothetical protein J0H58_14740 [bacterium]|nr:hypothetical protein [bacterium]
MSEQTTFVKAFVEEITPFLRDKDSRVAALQAAFPDNEHLKGLECEGSSTDSLPILLRTLDEYGRLKDGHLALIVFIDAVKQLRCGVDVEAQLTALQEAYSKDYEAALAARVERRLKQTLVRTITSRSSLVVIAVGFALGIVLTLLVAFAPSLYRAAFPPRYEVQYSSLSSQLSAAIKDPDESNAGVTVEDTELTVDMRPEVQVPIEQRDIRINPSTHSYAIRAVRHEDSTKVFVLAFASQRQNMDVVCLNHQYEVRRSRSAHIAGKGYENVWHLLVDISDRSLNIPFEIQVRTVRWNAYQADNENYVGKIVSSSEKQFTVRVLIPDGRVLQDKPELQQHPKSPSPPIEGFNGSGELSLSGDRKAFEWKVVQPRQGFVYRAKIFWEAAPQPPMPVSPQRWKIAGGKFEPAG